MRKLTAILWLGYLSFFFACDADQGQDLVDGSAIVTSARGAEDCRTCEAISVSLLKSEGVKDCCGNTLLVRNVDNLPNCGQVVVLNGKVLGEANKPTSTFDLITCPDETNTIEIYGYNEATGKYDDLCYENELSCGGCDCESALLDIQDLGKDSLGCCIYEVNASLIGLLGATSCSAVLDMDGEIFDLSQVSVKREVTVCEEDLDVALYIKGVLCEQETLSCLADDCCSGTSYEVLPLGPQTNGCCQYEVIVANDATCTQFVFDDNGSVVFSIGPGSEESFTLEACQGASNTYYIGSSFEPSDLCDRFVLSDDCASSGNCCDNVEVKSTAIGKDINDCCAYRVTIANEGDCDQILFNDQGYEVTIPAGETLTESITVCSSSIGIGTVPGVTYYLGPTNDPAQACDKLTLLFECN